MPSPEQIYQQVVRLTADLVGLSVCNHQNFPSLRDVGRGVKELGLGGKSDLSIALKNVAYRDVYDELERTQTYNLKMLDGALIQMLYRFNNEVIETHRLAFFPSPYLEEFQNNPEIYIADEVYAEVIMPTLSRCKTRKNLLPSAECFYGRLRTIQGRSRDGLGPC